jgi:arylsulfatase A-like enzyme
LRQLVSLLDLPPTLLDAAGIGVPAQMQGRSILPLLRGESAGWPEEVFIQISESQIGRALRTARWKYSVVAPGVDGNSAPGADRYVEEYFYDLEADPHELTNLVNQAAYRDIKIKLRERLIERMVAAGEAAPLIEPAPEQPSEQRRVTIAEVRNAHVGR